MADAYPLAWPAGFPRTENPKKAAFRTTLHTALTGVQDELRRLGITDDVVMSSNVTLGSVKPKDPGVACYFIRDGRQLCIPCDAWTKVEDNLRAIQLTIEALRGIERWGAKHMVDAAFSGFASLPPPNTRITDKSWRKVLGVTDTATKDQIETAYRSLARRCHPDAGGSEARMAEINSAMDSARKEIGEAS